jgi:hypothetical protein
MMTRTSCVSTPLETRLFAVLLLGAAGLAGCSGGGSTPPPPSISVSITNKVTTIIAGAAAVTFNASVQNDSTNAGVTWTLTAGGASCSPACGKLSGATAATVTYTPPGSLPAAPNNAPTITATSVKDSTKSDSDALTVTAPAAISVTITNKITTILVASAPVTLNAQVQNDATNSGVMWALTSDGLACSPSCGAISGATATSVTYTPPSTIPGVPNNAPTITATSVKDPTKSDSDLFTFTGTISVTITNKITSIAAAATAISFNASLQNDAISGVVAWSLTAGGAACSPACGTLVASSLTTAVYTPPLTLPTAPNNTPTVTATSVGDKTKFDSDPFTITAPAAVTVTIAKKFTSIPAGSTAVTLSAQVPGDTSGLGVTWALTVGGADCPVDCGSLTDETRTSVTYTPPFSVPAAPDNRPTITATSVANTTKSDTNPFTIVTGPVKVTIIDKVNTMQAGSAPITLTALVTNDPANLGVLWELNGCAPADCGTLAAASPTTATYTPPAHAAASPNNVAPIAAVARVDTTKSDFDSIGIISGTPASCAGMPTGHESLIYGQYAFFAQGDAVMAGEFDADGNGHFMQPGSGGIGGNVGSLDINDGSNPTSITLVGSNSGAGGYTVGPDPSGDGDVGCLGFYGADGSGRVFRFTLGKVSAGVATAGRITEYDEQSINPSGIPTRVSGVLLRQDPTAFSTADTSHLLNNYTIGLVASNIAFQGSLAGALVLNPATGAITNSDFDFNGIDSAIPTVHNDIRGSTGAIASVSPLTGRGIFTFSPISPFFFPNGTGQTQAAIYIVNANEFFLVSLDPPGVTGFGALPAFVYAGRAIASGSAFTSTSISGNNIFHANELIQFNSTSGPKVDLGLLNFSGGSLTGTIFGYASMAGASTTTVNETYTVDPTFGRVALTGTGLTNSPVFYLTAPAANTEPITAFASGMDPSATTAIFGLLEPGAAANVTTASLSGNYFFGDEDLAVDGSAVSRAGVMGISTAGALTGTEFDSAEPPAFLSQPSVSGTVMIDNAKGPGTGNVGPNSVAITNGTELFFIKEGAGTPATIIAAEHQ